MCFCKAFRETLVYCCPVAQLIKTSLPVAVYVKILAIFASLIGNYFRPWVSITVDLSILE